MRGRAAGKVSTWEDQAENWARWARAPGDEYWVYRDAFFGTIVPPAGRLTLEVGSGEGRVARDLVARGHQVVGVDTSPTLLRYAKAAGPGACYLLADGAALPFADGSVDLVVAYNSLMDVDDMPGTIREVFRVLGPGGRLCACVTHPFADAGELVGEGPDARFTLTRPYFGRHRFEGTGRRDGLTMTFCGWTYALEEYAMALANVGMLVELLREPRPAAASASNAAGSTFPMFLYIRALKPRGG